MIRIIKSCKVWIWAVVLGACQDPKPPEPTPEPAFGAGVVVGRLEATYLAEVSGLVAGQNQAGMLWTHNDSGGQAVVYLLDKQGKMKGSLLLTGRSNRDWEDIALTNFTDGAYLYVADIGDNDLKHESYEIYRVKEPPGPLSEQVPTASERIVFRYPDAPHDAEAMLIDHQTKDIYLITKRDTQSKIYRLPYPQRTTALNEAVYVADLPFTWATGASASFDNQEILIKNYLEVFYWKRLSGETLADALRRAPQRLPYTPEPQGEAIAWAADGSGYYTLSEGEAAKLYWYKKQ